MHRRIGVRRSWPKSDSLNLKIDQLEVQPSDPNPQPSKFLTLSVKSFFSGLRSALPVLNSIS